MEKEQIAERIKEIEAAMGAADFWSDPQRAQALIKELQDLKAEAEGGSAYDRGGAIVGLVAGAGGDDAEDFVRMLFEMYRKYFEKRGWSAHVDGERTQGANKDKALAIIKAKLLRLLEQERKEKISDLSVMAGKIEWGSQIRSYVLHPYKLVKDHRSGVEVRDAEGVLDGDLEPFLEKAK